MARRPLVACAWSVAAGVLVLGGGSAAAGEPTLSVSPNTGLEDGQTVEVTGSGFTPSSVVYPYTDRDLYQCRPEAIQTDDVQRISQGCGNGQSMGIAADGTVQDTFVVQRVVRTVHGYDFRCDESSEQCVVVAIAWGSRVGIKVEASAPVSFAPK